MQLQKKFQHIYDHNLFGGLESMSGEGSDLKQTEIIRSILPDICTKYNIKSLNDAPCGDFYWMKTIITNLGLVYRGFDIVPSIINQNNTNYFTENISFQQANLVTQIINSSDLIICRDCLVHLDYKDGLNVISNFKKSGSKYLIITTYLNQDQNLNLGKINSSRRTNWMWRTLNMQKFPYNFPEPIEMINENCSELNGILNDKCLGMWKLEDIDIGIPKIIYTIWIGDKKIPDDVIKCIESQKLICNDGYKHILITNKELYENKVLMNTEYIQKAIAVQNWVKLADYIRMWYLYNYGGIYLDADVEYLQNKNFDNFLLNHFFASKEENLFVSNACFGMIKNHPMGLEYLEDVVKNFKGDDKFIFESGMELFTKKAYKYNDCDNIILSSDYFIPYNHQTGVIKITENTIVYHHFKKSWI